MKTMKRKAGYYWVDYQGSWIIMEWVLYNEAKFYGHWYHAGSETEYDDSEFREIDEKPLTRE